MDGKRQNIQLELALEAESTSEAQRLGQRGTETSMAEGEAESLAEGEPLMEQVCERENLKRALAQVKRNKGSAGVDAMSVQQFSPYLKAHWPVIREQLLVGHYGPQPVKRVEIPKPGGGKRKLGIPCVGDRFVQQALLQVLQPIFEPSFAEASYGFRPGRSAHQAIRRAQDFIGAGHEWVVDLDLVQFFDRVNHDLLMARVAKRVRDKRVLKLIRAYLTRLQLQVNEAKSAVARPWQRKFLGFSYCETPSVLRALDQWIRRRLRSLVWKQWRRGRRRYAALVARGVGRDLAAQTAGSAHGPWQLAVSPARHFALPNALFVTLGLPTLAVSASA